MARRELSSQKNLCVISIFLFGHRKKWVPALHEVSHGPAIVTTKWLKQCGRWSYVLKLKSIPFPPNLSTWIDTKHVWKMYLLSNMAPFWANLAAKFQGRSISGHIYSSQSFEPKSSRCRGGNAIRSPPRFVRTGWSMWICIILCPGSPSWIKLCPCGRIGNPFVHGSWILKTKHFVWSTGLRLRHCFNFNIPQDAGHWTNMWHIIPVFSPNP